MTRIKGETNKAKKKENNNEDKNLCSDDGSKRMEIFKQKFGRQSFTCTEVKNKVCGLN
jgi:hypothetical protein